MEELKKCYEKLQAILKEMEAKHETPVDNFINLDEDCQKDFMGDWTEEDLKTVRICFETCFSNLQSI